MDSTNSTTSSMLQRITASAEMTEAEVGEEAGDSVRGRFAGGGGDDPERSRGDDSAGT